MRGSMALNFGWVSVHIMLAFSLCTPAAPFAGGKQAMSADQLSGVMRSLVSPLGEYLRTERSPPAKILSLRGGGPPKTKQKDKPQKKREEKEKDPTEISKLASPRKKEKTGPGKKTASNMLKSVTPARKSTEVKQAAKTLGKQKKKEPVLLSDDDGTESGSEEEDVEESGTEDSAGSEEKDQSEDDSKGSEEEEEEEEAGSLIKGALVNIAGLDGLEKEGGETSASPQGADEEGEGEDESEEDEDDSEKKKSRKKDAGKAKSVKGKKSDKGGGSDDARKSRGGEVEMSLTVHVGGIPYGVSQEEVLAAIGKVCGRKTMVGLRWPNKQNRNCGWGFLDFVSKKAAANAIKLCEAAPIVMQERTLALKPALPKPPGGGEGGKGGKVREEKGKIGKEAEEGGGGKRKREGGKKEKVDEGGDRKRAGNVKADGEGKKKRRKGSEA